MSKRIGIHRKIEIVEGTLVWLDNLIAIVGNKAALDCMPNSHGGRVWLRALLEELKDDYDALGVEPPPAVGEINQ